MIKNNAEFLFVCLGQLYSVAIFLGHLRSKSKFFQPVIPALEQTDTLFSPLQAPALTGTHTQTGIPT